MTNALDALFQLNKSFIMSSKFQNSLYKGQPVYAYLGEKPSTYKAGKSFYELLLKMIDKLPIISYEKLLKKRNIYEKYQHLYLRFIGHHNYLVNIGDFCRHIDTYTESSEIPISFFLPSFFSRYYTIRWLNITTKTTRDETYNTPQGNVPTEAREVFLHLFYLDKSYEDILESLDWADYKKLIVELNEDKQR